MTNTDLSNEFAGRRAFVTGGSRGIGAAIAQRLLEGGATVVVTARSRHETTPEGASFIAGDLSTNAGAKEIALKALNLLGSLDILVNNAGAARLHLPGTAAISDEEWQDALDRNYLSAVRVTAALLPALVESKAAAIINISSGGVKPTPAPLLHYGAAKAALNAYSLGLAQEVASNGIRVNVVTPGHILTPGGDGIRKELSSALGVPPEALFATIPLRRPGQPQEVAELVAFLASDRGNWITGQNYHIDGGLSSIGKG